MRTRLIASGLVALSIVYLALFVPRGWVPHDEGMLGQSAERVVNGETPHVDFEEPYTGGLSWLHATLFRAVGIDLVYLRWLLFAGAIAAQLLIYSILRRYVSPIGAALGAWLSLAWSFPNYFAALPSWWILICGIASVWAFVRFVESGLLRYAAAAGLAAGLAILMKQTGVYVLVALAMALLYDGGGHEQKSRLWWPGRAVCAAAAVGSLALAVAVIASRLSLSDLLYLLLPILACSRLLVERDGSASSRPSRHAFVPAAVAMAAAALPVAIYLAPYVFNGHVSALINGLVVLPQKRMQFASLELPPAHWLLAGLPLVAVVMPWPARVRFAALETGAATIVLWFAGLLLAATSVNVYVSYQIIWQTARSFAAVLPIALCSHLMSGRVRDAGQRRILFGTAVFLAWASLVQVPFSAPIYFCYVTPFAVIAALTLAANTSAVGRPAFAVATAVLLAFALVSMNRGYIYNLGGLHRTVELNEPVGVERASLRVSPADAVTYRRIVELIGSHIGDGHLVAGPDAPEVYFLTGRFSASGAFFDFFTDRVSAEGGLQDMEGLHSASVVVLNHGRRFSQGPSAHLASKARRMFPHSEGVGTFEVRWR